MIWQYSLADGPRPHRLETTWDIFQDSTLPDHVKNWSMFCKKNFGNGGRADFIHPKDNWGCTITHIPHNTNPTAPISNAIMFEFKELSHITLFRLFAG